MKRRSQLYIGIVFLLFHLLMVIGVFTKQSDIQKTTIPEITYIQFQELVKKGAVDEVTFNLHTFYVFFNEKGKVLAKNNKIEKERYLFKIYKPDRWFTMSLGDTNTEDYKILHERYGFVSKYEPDQSLIEIRFDNLKLQLRSIVNLFLIFSLLTLSILSFYGYFKT